MAIKAGLVGVNPKGVDKNGMPISSGGANVEAEIQQINLDIAQLQASKVGIGQLTANNKAFHFAYDNTTEKYGYKLDGTGDFIPFEQAGGGPGWVKPASFDPTLISISTPENAEIVDGGLFVDNDGNAYLDVIVHQISGAGNSILLPVAVESCVVMTYYATSKDAVIDKYVASYYAGLSLTSGHSYINFGNSSHVGRYTHFWGQFKIAS